MSVSRTGLLAARVVAGLAAASLIALALPRAARAGSPPLTAPLTAPFTAIVLGTAGGLDEANLTSVLLAHGGDDYIALDAGTLYAGISAAINEAGPDEQNGTNGFGRLAPPTGPTGSTLSLAGYILRERIKAVLISHPHLDHVAGLAIAAPDDAPKPIFGTDATLAVLRDSLFNGRLWANFTNEGPAPLGKYTLVRLAAGVPAPIPRTPFSVEAWPLSHGPVVSTAFLLRDGAASVLYLGDTGADAIEKSDKLHSLFVRIAPLIRAGSLRGIFIECSYPDPRPAALLFGHLTPSLLISELSHLAALVDEKSPATALRDLTLVITHIKPSLQSGPSPRDQISRQLAPLESRLKLVIPTRGRRITID